MIIKKFFLENYGLYAGKNEFDLVPKKGEGQKKNIVLIGGKNGVGKTTFLNGIRLALYGKSALGKRISQREYETFLRNQIHQGQEAILKNTFSKLAVEFQHVVLGEYRDYRVERSWQIDGKGIKEFLKIHSDGELRENVTNEYWNGFIEEIIPERLSQLFFFDGEKIQEIAKETTENMVLAESIKTLLGLDIVERLQADLSIYKTREVKNASLNDFKKQSEKIEQDISEIIERILRGEENLAEINSKISGNLGDILSWEKRLSEEGGHFASRRTDNIENKNRLNKRVSELEELIRNECIDIYPFSLCPSINRLLKNQVQDERELSRHLILENEIQSFRTQILSRLNEISFKEDSDKRAVAEVIAESIEQKVKYKGSLNADEVILNFSESLAEDVLQIIESAEKTSSSTVESHSRELEDAYKQIREITKTLAKSPDDSQVKPLFEELSLLNQRQGELKQKKKQMDELISSLKNDLKIYRSNLKKLTDKQKIHDQTQMRIQMVNKIDSMLALYYKKLREVKIEQLNQSFSESFNNLMSKKIVERISIDPKTFEVTLYDHKGNKVSKEAFSSGEKQLYAIAMLWSLAKTSGRPLPVIIDTPLGRLDSHHRANLIENYYPKASHQVVLLSTDTEVDEKIYTTLNPSLSHCYELKYDDEQGRTTVKNGYFWRKQTSCLN